MRHYRNVPKPVPLEIAPLFADVAREAPGSMGGGVEEGEPTARTLFGGVAESLTVVFPKGGVIVVIQGDKAALLEVADAKPKREEGEVKRARRALSRTVEVLSRT